MINACMGYDHVITNTKGFPRTGAAFMTNFVCIAQKLSKKCPNRQGHQIHSHVRLESGRTRVARVYAMGLCKAICEGLQEQIAMAEKGQFLIMNVNDTKSATSNGLRQSAEKLNEKFKTVGEGGDEELEAIWDDVSGAELDPKIVKAARQEEIDYVRKMHL